MPELKDYDLTIGYNVDRPEPEKVAELEQRLSSRFKSTTEKVNSTVDITCRDVWFKDIGEYSKIGEIGFTGLLCVGFKARGRIDGVDEDDPGAANYFFSIMLLDSQLEGIKYELEEVLGVNAEGLEWILLSPKELGKRF